MAGSLNLYRNQRTRVKVYGSPPEANENIYSPEVKPDISITVSVKEEAVPLATVESSESRTI